MEDIRKHSDPEKIKSQYASDHLANERTFLAWMRTSIGIMAFGFVVVKFSLFLRQLSLLLGKNAALPPPTGYSSAIGIVLVAVGAVVLILAYLKYKKTEKQIQNENFQPSSPLALFLTIVILILSLLLIFYLIQNTGNISVFPFSEN